jgi:transcriptional regulator with XRE-family HTH domain
MKKIYNYRAVGNRIKFLRGEGRTQEEFAALLGVSLSAYQRYEYGDRIPPFKTISKISNICNVSTDWIIYGRGVKGEDIKVDEPDFSDAIDRMEYLFERGSFALLEFFNMLLNYASNVAHGGFDNEEGADLIEFLTFINEISSSKLREILNKRKDLISYTYIKDGKRTRVSYKTKTKKNKKPNKE